MTIEIKYVRGYRCTCGKLWPELGPFPPWPPAPDVCTLCGSEEMERTVLIEKRFETGFFFKRQHVKYVERGKETQLPKGTTFAELIEQDQVLALHLNRYARCNKKPKTPQADHMAELRKQNDLLRDALSACEAQRNEWRAIALDMSRQCHRKKQEPPA